MKSPLRQRTAQERYELLAREYVIDHNATRAAKAAGYKARTATDQGSRLLTIVKVRELVDKLESDRASRLGIQQERVLEEISRIAFSNIADFYQIDESGMFRIDLSRMTRDQAACIQEIKVDTVIGPDGRRSIIRTTIEFADKLKSLDMLMRHLGAYNDRMRTEGLESLTDIVEKRWGDPVPLETKECKKDRVVTYFP